MKEWMTAAEIAALKLPGLPTSERGNQIRADRDGWEKRKRSGAGGGFEYRVASLPGEAQKSLARKHMKAPSTLVKAELPAPSDLKDFQRDPMTARTALLNHIDHLVLFTGISQGMAINALVEAASKGTLDRQLQEMVLIANARSNSSRTLTRATIYNWLKARQAADGNIVALATKAPPPTAIPGWAQTFMELYCRPSKPGIAESLDRWPEGVEKPSYDQARRLLKRVDAVTKNRGRMGPKALQQLRAYIARDASELWPGAVFIGDGHTFKAEIAHPRHGRPFRPEVTSFLDVYTRRWVGWSTALAENTWSVADALRHAVTTTTCCDIVYYDNGSGAKNDIWDNEVTGLINRLCITKLHSAPWTSQARGVVERFHSSVMHTEARWLPTYAGQRLDKEAALKTFKITRKDIKETGSSKLLPTWRDFAEVLDEAMKVYNDRPHSSLPKIVDDATGKRRHMSPNEMWADAIAKGWTPQPISSDQAVDLFRPEEVRLCRRGLVELYGNVYYADALQALHGEKVRVRFDIHDPQKVWIYLVDGRFSCVAEWNAHKRSYVAVSFAKRAEEKRIAGIVERLDDHRKVALEESTPTIAASFTRVPEAAPISAEEAKWAKIIEAEWQELPNRKEIAADAEFDLPQITAPKASDTLDSRFRKMIDIENRLAAGLAVSEIEQGWAKRQAALSDIKGLRMVFDVCGEEALTA